jgi:hypothetical protein
MALSVVDDDSRSTTWLQVLGIYGAGLWRMLLYGVGLVGVVAVCGFVASILAVQIVGVLVPLVLVVGLSALAYWSIGNVRKSSTKQNVVIAVVVGLALLYVAGMLVGHVLKSVGL